VPGRRSRLSNLGDFDFHAASERGRLASWARVCLTVHDGSHIISEAMTTMAR
jgi:hypothetical protein